MASIVVKDKRVNKALNKLEKFLLDASPAFREIAELELSQTKMRFRNQEDPDNKKWPEPFTIRRDGRGGRNTQFENPWSYVVASNYHAAPPGYHFFDSARGDKILRDTSNLFNSLGIAFGKDYAIVGTNVEYARKHQEGDGVKARPFLGINMKTYNNIEKIVLKYVERAVI